MLTKSDLKQGDMVYVRRGSFLEAAKVEGTYTSATGVDGVMFWSGPNASLSDVMTYDQYWEHQRNAMREAVDNG